MRRWLLLVVLGSLGVASAHADTMDCPPIVVEGVDASFQTGIDWSSVQSSGRGFAFVKATQGNYGIESTFAFNWPGLATAGMLRGPYHFFDPTIDGVTQANYFLAVVNATGGLQRGDLPSVLDLECPTSSNQMDAAPDCEYSGDSGWVPPSVLAQRVFDWLAVVQAATGRKPIIYSYPGWFEAVGFTDASLANYPLFIATIGSCASVPSPWTTTTFWQYSFTGSVPGIPGSTDLDRFTGSAADLQRLVDTIFADGFDQ